MALKDQIKKLDVFKIIPEDMKESTYHGLLCSAFFIFISFLLILNQLSYLISPAIETEIMIDHLKDDKDVLVSMNIALHKYPCGLVSLDKLDEVTTHIVDVEENLQKIRINKSGNIIGVYKNNSEQTFEDKIRLIKEQAENKEGCLLNGTFTVKMVPGNFHISFHNYGREFQYLYSNRIYFPDFSHTINSLIFSMEDSNIELIERVKSDFGIETHHTLSKTNFKFQPRDFGEPNAVTHTINVIPSKFEYSEKEVYDLFQYTATSDPVQGSQDMWIVFYLNIENIIMHYKRYRNSISHVIIQCMIILGGLFMFLMIIKGLFESITSVIYKKSIGKLE